MSDLPKINGREVTKEEFEEIRSILSSSQIEISILEDQEFSGSEIDTFVDQNKDGKNFLHDLANRSKQLGFDKYARFSEILKNAGYNLYDHVTDFQESLDDEIIYPDPINNHSNDYKNLWYDKSFVLKALELKKNVVWDKIPFQLRKDPDIILIGFKMNPATVTRAPAVGFTEDVIKALGKECVNSLQYQYLGQLVSWKEDSGGGLSDELIMSLCLANHNILAYLPSDKNVEVWKKIATVLKAKHLFPEGYLDGSYEFFLDKVKTATTFPGRFQSFETLAEIVKSQFPPPPTDARPVALLLYTKRDWNDAFEFYPLADRFVEDGQYRVVYREVKNEDEMLRVISEISHDGNQPIDTLVIAGHGYSQGIALGGPDPRNYSRSYHAMNEKDYLTTGDLTEKRFSKLYKYLKPEAQVLLYSCSTASGGEKTPYNFANQFTYSLRKSTTLYASEHPSNIIDFKISDERKLKITWFDQLDYYETQGKRRR